MMLHVLGAMLLPALCRRTECASLAAWAQYTLVVEQPTIAAGFCRLDGRNHLAQLTLDCDALSPSYTCSSCRRSRLFRGCGRFECGGKSAGMCVQQRCECNPGYVLNDETACELAT